ncbi:MAG: hypothetical protein GXY13_01985 [Acidimicrobiales bacterium]|nr:hypothetical protein [Acidimicrobiales bacterium]
MAADDPTRGAAPGRVPVPSAAPPTAARVLAIASIVVSGLCGGLIGYGVTDLQTRAGDGSSGGAVWPAVGGLVGAVAAAAGVAVVAVLVLRAMTEWQTIVDRAAAEGREPPRRRDVRRS